MGLPSPCAAGVLEDFYEMLCITHSRVCFAIFNFLILRFPPPALPKKGPDPDSGAGATAELALTQKEQADLARARGVARGDCGICLILSL